MLSIGRVPELSDQRSSVGAMNESERARQWIVAKMEREFAQMKAADEAIAVKDRPRRKMSGPSVVYSIRLDRSEVDALERRAALMNIKPTVLARNLVRIGLATNAGADVAGAIDRLEAALEDLRSLVP